MGSKACERVGRIYVGGQLSVLVLVSMSDQMEVRQLQQLWRICVT